MKKLTIDNLWLLATVLLVGIFLTSIVQAKGLQMAWPAQANSCAVTSAWQICQFTKVKGFGIQDDALHQVVQLTHLQNSNINIMFFQQIDQQGRKDLFGAPENSLQDARYAPEYGISFNKNFSDFGVHLNIQRDYLNPNSVRPMLVFGISNSW